MTPPHPRTICVKEPEGGQTGRGDLPSAVALGVAEAVNIAGAE